MSSGTPVGNMIIKVDLDAVGLEKSMTGLQRQLKSSNTAMGAQLSAFDRGEKSASKYGVLIEGLSNRHKVQGQMVDEARIKYDHMTETYGENSVKAQQAAQQLNEQISKYQETGRELDSVSTEFKEFQRVQEIQSKGWYKVADGMENYGGKLKAVGSKMDETGQTLTKKVSLPLSIVGGLAIKTGSDFEAGMSRVGAVSGASAEDMVKLEAKAREMGATTVFSASEASDAFYYMSLAGWDASESMDGIAGVMDLAAASGEDLASVADIVTDGLTAFGLQAKDSGRMADVLASASANANTDVNGLGQAFQYVAPVAGALGFTIEDTAKAIGLMSNAGIKSTKAGTALRTMMTNLAKPTSNAEKEMKKLGISLTDSKGNMKTFDEVMLDLRKGFKNLNKEQQAQAASTLFGKEAMSGALAIVNASEDDYNKLTSAIKDSDGAAADMAETMQDNLQGSIKELKSMVEDLFITMYKNLKPAMESTVDGAKDLTQWFANLSPETQELITKFGLLAFAGGPVLSMTGKLTSGIGTVMESTGGLIKKIGMSESAGLLGALSSLGPGAVAGIAVAGIGAVAYGVHQFKKKAKEAEEVNLELAESFTDQAKELEASANTFDKLSEKAKISNSELAELNDLNIKISESSNPGEIEELQKQYNELAQNSGLSKDELEKLFEANEFIIDQAPEVEKAVSDEGNAFVESTDKVNEYIESLYEMSRIELEAERTKQLANEKKIRDQLVASQEKENELKGQMNVLMGAYKGEVEDVSGRVKEINDRLLANQDSQEIQNALLAERGILQALEKGDLERASELYTEQIGDIQKALEGQKETTQSKQEELDKIEAIDMEMANVILKQAGINEEGTKGLQQLDESIAKSQEELSILDKKKESGEKLTEEEQKRYESLVESTEKQLEAKQYLYDELGIYSNINSLANDKISKLDEEKQKKIESLAKSVEIKDTEKDIVAQIDEKNNKLKKERDQLVENLEKQGKTKEEINKQTKELDTKISKNAEVKKQVLEELGIWKDLDKSIKDGIESEINKGKAVDETKGKLDSQGNSIDNNNSKTDIGIGKEQERTAEAGKDVDKNVDVLDKGTVADLNRRAMEKKDKPIDVLDYGTIASLNARASQGKNKPITSLDNNKSLAKLDQQASKPVNKVINFMGKGLEKLKFWAKGTPASGHPGGPAVVGDGGGRELVQLPSGRAFLSPDTDTLLNLPKGTQVTDHRNTAKLLKGVPKYAKGTGGGATVGSNTGGTFTLANIDRLDFATPINQSFNNSIPSIQSNISSKFKKLGLDMVTNIGNGFDNNRDIVNKVSRDLNKDIEKESLKLNKEIAKIQRESNQKEIVSERQLKKEISFIRKKAMEEERDLTNIELKKIELFKQEHQNRVLSIQEKTNNDLEKLEESKIKHLETLRKEATLTMLDMIDKSNDYEKSSLIGMYKEKVEYENKYLAKSKEIARKIKAQKNDIVQAEKAGNKKLIESRKATLDKILQDEKENSDKLQLMQQEAANFKKEIHDKLNEINTQYVEEIKKINDNLINEEKRLRDEYQKTLDDRTNSLISFAGIFDEIKTKEEISGQQLIDNLKGQVDAFESWANDIESLANKGIDKGLLEELRAMGPRAASEIAALNTLTEEELQQYSNIWQQKNELARKQATKELEGMKNDTEQKINELHEQSEKQLDELAVKWRIKVQDIRFGVNEEFNPMIADLTQIGKNSIEGMIDGINSMEGALMAKANSIAQAVKGTISSAFDINSPSRWMKVHIGENMMLGWMDGIDSEKRNTLNKAREMSEWMTPIISNFDKQSIRSSEFMKLLALTDINSSIKPISQNTTPDRDIIDFRELTELMKEFIEISRNPKEINQNNYYQGVSPLSPSEIARRNKQMLRKLKDEWR